MTNPTSQRRTRSEYSTVCDQMGDVSGDQYGWLVISVETNGGMKNWTQALNYPSFALNTHTSLSAVGGICSVPA